MKTTMRFGSMLAAGLLLGVPALWAQPTGGIEGRVIGRENVGLGGVSVTIEGLDRATTSGNNGTFAFTGVPAGTYTLTFAAGDKTATREGVEVTAGSTAQVELNVDWELRFTEAITVVSASRRAERITEAPAAVTVVTEQQIEREAAHGQLPKLLEFTPGAEVTQSGIYDFNFNTRGFNSSLNRRVATLIDGRNPSVPFLGSQEWAAVSFPLDDIASLELVRGPSAALYGANASSGVLNIVTKQPRYSQGGDIRLTGGERSTKNADLRWAGGLGGGWYAKVVGGVHDTGDFAVSRVGRAEYTVPCTARGQTDCLPQEVVPLARVNDDAVHFGSLRLDKYLSGGSFFTLEGGKATIKGPVFQTGIGRVQLIDVDRPWARANFTAQHFNLLGYYNARKAPEQLALGSGTNLALDSHNYQLEAQTNWSFADGKVRLVAGALYKTEKIDSADPATGRQTLLFAPVDADFRAVYSQLDWSATDKLKLVLAGRWDDSDLHASQFSPKASIVYSVTPDQTFRLTYNEAFQVGNYSELFLQANAAAPLNLQPFEALCAAGGTSCGFAPGPTRVLALGNKDLEVEKVKTFEAGYSGIFGNKAFLTLDYYHSDNENFITDLLSQVGTPLGRINPNFGPYQPPADLPEPYRSLLLAQLQAVLRTSYPLLSNNLDGTPILAAVSYTNFGKVNTQGVDLGLNYYFADDLQLAFSYSWFDFSIQQQNSLLKDLLLPNSPSNKAAAGLSYVKQRYDVGVSARWVDSFRWVVGPFQGVVESYTVADLNANVHLGDHWTVGANVANATDNRHWEAFGGDVLGRRALAHVEYAW
jgi:outer membrane receptor protein involved in Fe transport